MNQSGMYLATMTLMTETANVEFCKKDKHVVVVVAVVVAVVLVVVVVSSC